MFAPLNMERIYIREKVRFCFLFQFYSLFFSQYSSRVARSSYACKFLKYMRCEIMQVSSLQFCCSMYTHLITIALISVPVSIISIHLGNRMNNSENRDIRVKSFNNIIDDNSVAGVVLAIVDVINNILVILITIIIGTKCWLLKFTRTALHAHFCTLGVSRLQECRSSRFIH